MRKLIAILAGTVACSCLCLAADPEPVDALTITSVSTGTYTQSVNSVTNSIAYDGWLEGAWITISGFEVNPINAMTVSVDMIDGQGYGMTVIPPKAQITSNAWYAIRCPVQNAAGAAISNEGGKYPLYQNKFIFKAYQAVSNGYNASAYIYISH